MSPEVEEKLRQLKEQGMKTVSPELQDVIKDIAKTGRYRYPWELLKPLFAVELSEVMNNFLENFPPKNSEGTDTEEVKELQTLKDDILKTFNEFSSAPFTIQRLAELITQPRKHYKVCSKFYHGVLRNILVVSTVEPDITEERPPKKLKLQENGESSVNQQSTVESEIKPTEPPNDEEDREKFDVTQSEGIQDTKNQDGGSIQNSNCIMESSIANEIGTCAVIRKTLGNDRIENNTTEADTEKTDVTEKISNDVEQSDVKETEIPHSCNVKECEGEQTNEEVSKDDLMIKQQDVVNESQQDKVNISKQEPMDQS